MADEIDPVSAYATRLGDSPQVREALKVIIEADRSAGVSDSMPEKVIAAYRALDKAVGLPKSGPDAAPGADWQVFDPEAIYEAAKADSPVMESVSFGLPGRGSFLGPLRVLSFWKMKDRARQFGERGVHPFLVAMQSLTAGRDVRYHLAGHSFGCIVASSALAGPVDAGTTPDQVDSLVLLQGALSLWSYCKQVPAGSGKPGYFHRIIARQQVRGSIVTTQSRYDTAVGTWYPRAAWSAGQVEFSVEANLPTYGAVGAYGIQGAGLSPEELAMKSLGESYDFRAGGIYNIEGSGYIKDGRGFSGAHSDIRKPEVAHAVWSAVIG